MLYSYRTFVCFCWVRKSLPLRLIYASLCVQRKIKKHRTFTDEQRWKYMVTTDASGRESPTSEWRDLRSNRCYLIHAADHIQSFVYRTDVSAACQTYWSFSRSTLIKSTQRLYYYRHPKLIQFRATNLSSVRIEKASVRVVSGVASQLQIQNILHFLLHLTAV